MAEQLEIEIVLNNLNEVEKYLEKSLKEIEKYDKLTKKNEKSLLGVTKAQEKLAKAQEKLSRSLKEYSKEGSLALEKLNDSLNNLTKTSQDFSSKMSESLNELKKQLLDSFRVSENFKDSLNLENLSFLENTSVEQDLNLLNEILGKSQESSGKLFLSLMLAAQSGQPLAESIQMANEVLNLFGDNSTKALESLVALVSVSQSEANISFQTLASSFKGLSSEADLSQFSMLDLGLVFTSLSLSLDPLGNSLELTSLLMKETLSPSQELTSIYTSLGVSTDNLGQKQSYLTGNLTNLDKAYAKNKEVFNAYFQELQKGTKVYQTNGEVIVNLGGNLQKLSEDVSSVKRSFLEDMQSFNKSIKTLRKCRNMNSAIKNIANTLKNEFSPEVGVAFESVTSFGLSLGILNKETLENIETFFTFAKNLSDTVEKGKKCADALISLKDSYKGMNAEVIKSTVNIIKETAAKVKAKAVILAQVTATKAAAAAQGALNLVMSMNPIGAVVLAVTALIAALTSLFFWFSKNKTSNEDLNDSMEESSSAYDKNSNSIENNIKAQEKLGKRSKQTASEVEELAKKEESSVVAKEKLKNKINQLMAVYPYLTEEVIRSQIALEGGSKALLDNCNSINQVGLALEKACEEQKKITKGWWVFRKEVENPEALEKESDSQQWLDSQEEDLIKKLQEQGGSDLVELYYQSLYDDTQEFASEFDEKIKKSLESSDVFLAKALIERRKKDQAAAQKTVSELAQGEMSSKGISEDQIVALKKLLKEREEEISIIKSGAGTEEEKQKLVNEINDLYERNVKSLIQGPDLSEISTQNTQLDEKLEEAKNKYNSQLQEYKLFLKEGLDQLEKEKQEAQSKFEKNTNFDPDLEFKKVDIPNDPWGLGDILNIFGELMTNMDNIDKDQEKRKKIKDEKKNLEDTNKVIEAKKSVLEGAIEEAQELEKATDITVESIQEQSERIVESQKAQQEMLNHSPSSEESQEGSQPEESKERIEESTQQIIEAIDHSKEEIEKAQNQSSSSQSSDKSSDIEESTRSTVHLIKEGGEKEAHATQESAQKVEEAKGNSTSSFQAMAESMEETIEEGTDNNVQAIKEGGKAEQGEISKQGKKTGDDLTDKEKALKEKQKDLAMALAGSMANSVNSMVSDVANLAGQKHLQQLDELEEEINQRLQEYQEAREEEEERIREEKAEREREERLQEIELSIAGLEQQLANETSVKKRAQLASQIEEANKKKIEERKKREEELAEKERLRQEKIQLYEFEVEKYNIEVQRVERQNKMAEQEKAQKIAQVWIDSSMGIARAWAAQGSNLFTAWYPPVFTGLMAGVAAGQTAMIASQNVTTKAPAPPKPPKFKKGGVIGNHGEEGIDAVVGDGVSEVILPLTSETFKMFGAGVLQALQESIAKKESLFFDLEKSLGSYANEGSQIHIAHCENVFSPQQIINVNQTNNIPIQVNGEEEMGEKVEAIALKVVGEIKDNIKVGSNFDQALLSRSRGVLNALKDQGVL